MADAMASQRVAVNASDPSVDGSLLAWHEAGAQGVLLRSGGSTERVGGVHPAVGGGRLAVLQGSVIDLQATSGAAFAARIPAPGADALAVSTAWVVWRARDAAGDAINAAPLGGGAPRRVAAAVDLGRPALEGNLLAFHRDGRIVIVDLATGAMSTVRRERRAQLLNPSLFAGALLYVRASYRRQELRLGPLTRQSPRFDQSLWSTVPTARRDAGYEPGVRHHRHGHPQRLWRRPRSGLATTLWTTALADDAAYVTVLRQVVGKPLRAEIVRIAH